MRHGVSPVRRIGHGLGRMVVQQLLCRTDTLRHLRYCASLWDFLRAADYTLKGKFYVRLDAPALPRVNCRVRGYAVP
jgi:hypothetical protein